MGLRPVQMAGRLGLTLTEYRALEAGELHIGYDLYLRITDLCGGQASEARRPTRAPIAPGAARASWPVDATPAW